VAGAGEILALQRAACVTEAQLPDDLTMPALTRTSRNCRLNWQIRAAWPGASATLARLVASVRVYLAGDTTADIRRAVVAPGRQGQGPGTAMLATAQDNCRPRCARSRCSLASGAKPAAL
jgi:GNAT superfamily N-acetyltransferase